MTSDPLAPFLSGGGVLVLDGGLATELEKAGFDLGHPLWSARLLETAPEAIASVHRLYLEAGADCITTASYQATLAGFEREGRSRQEADALLRRSVTLALEVRDALLGRRTPSRRPPASPGRGQRRALRGVPRERRRVHGRLRPRRGWLREFHRERLTRLAASGADLLACETVPSASEARALGVLLAESPGRTGLGELQLPRRRASARRHAARGVRETSRSPPARCRDRRQLHGARARGEPAADRGAVDPASPSWPTPTPASRTTPHARPGAGSPRRSVGASSAGSGATPAPAWSAGAAGPARTRCEACAQPCAEGRAPPRRRGLTAPSRRR